jgi:hypothetical protein
VASVRSEYRRRYDRQAALTQDVQDEIDQERDRQLAPEPRNKPLPEPRPTEIGVMPHNANGQGQHTAAAPPWQDELLAGRELHRAANVQAPPSREHNSYSYSPQQDVRNIRLTAEQAELARKCNVTYEEMAAQVMRLQFEKRNDPLKYSGQG